MFWVIMVMQYMMTAGMLHTMKRTVKRMMVMVTALLALLSALLSEGFRDPIVRKQDIRMGMLGKYVSKKNTWELSR